MLTIFEDKVDLMLKSTNFSKKFSVNKNIFHRYIKILPYSTLYAAFFYQNTFGLDGGGLSHKSAALQNKV